MIRKRRNPVSYETATFQETELFIIQKAQHEQFSKEIQCIQQGLHIPKNSRIAALGPVLDSQNMLRVGGRLNNLNLDKFEKNPLIIPGTHHISSLLIFVYLQNWYTNVS